MAIFPSDRDTVYGPSIVAALPGIWILLQLEDGRGHDVLALELIQPFTSLLIESAFLCYKTERGKGSILT